MSHVSPNTKLPSSNLALLQKPWSKAQPRMLISNHISCDEWLTTDQAKASGQDTFTEISSVELLMLQKEVDVAHQVTCLMTICPNKGHCD